MRQAVILVGGLGTRLRSLGFECPKPMVEIGGVPFVRHVVREFARFGVENILMVAGHRGDMVAAAFDGARLDGAEIRVVIEPEPRGTAGALDFARPFLEPEFVMANGDTLFVTDLAAFLAEPLAEDVDARLLTRVVEDASRYGSVEIAPDGRIVAFVEKRSGAGAQAISAGICVLRAAALDGAVTTLPCSLEVDVFPRWVARGRMEAVRGAGYFLDIGLPETYRLGCEEVPEVVGRPAAFLDRALVVDDEDGGRPRPGAIEAIGALNRSGRYVVVVGGPDERRETERPAERAVQNRLMRAGAHVDAFRRRIPEGTGERTAPATFLDCMADWPIAARGSFYVGEDASALAGASTVGIAGWLLSPGDDPSDIVRAALAALPLDDRIHLTRGK